MLLISSQIYREEKRKEDGILQICGCTLQRPVRREQNYSIIQKEFKLTKLRLEFLNWTTKVT